MNRFHNFKRWSSLLLCLLLLLGVFGACNQAQEAAAPITPPIVVKNSGRESVLTIGCMPGQTSASAAREDALREIAAKYTADFPNTSIEVRAFDDPDELLAALQAGEVQLLELESDSLDRLNQGALLDLRPYLEGWEEYTTLDGPAKAVLAQNGSENPCYLMPIDFLQPLLFYRADWFKAYNADKEWRDRIHTENWDGLLSACEKLDSQIIFVERDAPLLFNTVLWSDLGSNALADPGAAYFAAPPVIDGELQEVTGETIFTASAAPAAVETFQKLLGKSQIMESQEAAEAAFLDGQAAALIADRTILQKLSSELPEGAFAVQGLPQGKTETTVTSLYGFSGWGISAQVEDWESAVHFLFFLSDADNNTHYAKVGGTLPIHVTAEDLEGSLAEGLFATEVDLLSKGGEYQYAWIPNGYTESENWDETLSVKLNDITEESGPDALLRWLDETWAAAFRTQGKQF